MGKGRIRLFSVIVAAYNEEKNIKKCLDSIGACGFEDYELIAVVAGDDRTYDIAKKSCDLVIRDTLKKGAGPARNLGAKRASGKVLVFTDGDVVVCDEWLDSYARAFADSRLVAAGGPVLAIDGGLKERIAYKLNSDWFYKLSALVGFYQLSGNNCAYRADMFEKADGFDESLYMLEDTELSNRAPKFGGVRVLSDAIVYASTRRMQKDGAFGMAWLYLKAYFYRYVLKKEFRVKYFSSAE